MQYYTSFTSPYNPPGVAPVITREQAFKALLVKAEKPTAFVPIITESEVISRSENGFTRRVKVEEGHGPLGGVFDETVEIYGNLRVDFHMIGAGQRVQNIISVGAGGPEDLYITFGFTYEWPDVQDGTPEAEGRKQAINAMAAGVAPGSVAQTREMVKKGEI